MSDDEVPSPSDVDNDYWYTRRNHYELVQSSKPVLEALKNLALEAEHHNVFEVYFKAFKIISDSNLNFLDLQRKKQVIDQDNLETTPKPPVKAIESKTAEGGFVGSAADLLNAIDAEFKDFTPDGDGA